LLDLAARDRKNDVHVLLDVIAALGDRKDDHDESVVFDLIRLLSGRTPTELNAVRGELEKLATSGPRPILRQVGYVALINVDGNGEKAWRLATRSVQSLRDLLAAMPLIADAGLRAGLYPNVESLLAKLPHDLSGGSPGTNAVSGRFVRIELAG